MSDTAKEEYDMDRMPGTELRPMANMKRCNWPQTVLLQTQKFGQAKLYLLTSTSFVYFLDPPKDTV